MAQKFFNDKVLGLAQSAGIITLGTGSILTIGGQQYTLSANVTLTIPTLTASTLYFLYATVSNGVVSLVQSTNVNSIGPSGAASWKLVGGYYSNAAATFDVLVNRDHTPSSFTIKASGSGNYSPPLYCPWIKVKMVGGGGGGAGGGQTNATDGTAGTSTTFGTSLLTAGPGSGGTHNSVNFTPGGSPTVNSPAIQIAALTGGGGNGGGGQGGSINSATPGGKGGDTPFGGSGAGSGALSGAQTTGQTAGGNTGSGGGGGSSSSSGATPCFAGAGGGAGAYIEAVIYASSFAAPYAYSVGTAGSGGSQGTVGGGAGGNGAAGQIIIEEGRLDIQQLELL